MNAAAVTPDQAWEIIAGIAAPLPAQEMALEAAAGFYLAEPATADRDIPAADRSAMDGYALRSADCVGAASVNRAAEFVVIGEIAAGQCVGGEGARIPELGAGQCLRIFTGANIPPGADAVVRVEDTSQENFGRALLDKIQVRIAPKSGDHYFRRGENARRGETLIPAGARLGPRQIASAASCGAGRVRVHGRPRVAVMTTGSELLSADAPAPGDHEIRDGNSPMIEAACREEGFETALRLQIEDALAATVAAIERAAACAKAIIMTGGVSAGRHDYVRPALEKLGAIFHYHGVAIRPGRPQVFATLPCGALVFALPGNPLSAVAGLYEFALPALRRMAGCPADKCRPILRVPIADSIAGAIPVLRMIPARLKIEDGRTVARIVKTVGSADLVAAGRAEGGILIPAGAEGPKTGEFVDFRMWGAA